MKPGLHPFRKITGCYALLIMLSAAAAFAKPIPVQLRENSAGNWELLRDGKPYFIKGAGGHDQLKLLVECGGNSIRTWGVDNLGPKLDEAHQLGLTVTVGIWLGHERHGFKYGDERQVTEQFERARRAIEQYKDHPAILMWGIGNEMEGERGDDPKIWSAVDEIAKLAEELDPNHPTMTVIAEIGDGGRKATAIHKCCPNIDVIGINAYGGAPTVARRYREAGGKMPFVLTEFGPNGFWESPKTSWGAPIEPTSTEKVKAYRGAYEGSVLSEQGKLCLGSYAFLWGQKQEATPTWFGMLLKDGARTAAVDVMHELWIGKPPVNRCPRIESLQLSIGDTAQPPGARVTATLVAADPDNDALRVRWEMREEPTEATAGGDAQHTPPVHDNAVEHADKQAATVRLPTKPGGYRLFAYVYDSNGGAAVANVPLLVQPQPVP